MKCVCVCVRVFECEDAWVSQATALRKLFSDFPRVKWEEKRLEGDSLKWGGVCVCVFQVKKNILGHIYIDDLHCAMA